MRQRLKDYLGVSPKQPLRAQAQAETPFGLPLDVSHPDGKPSELLNKKMCGLRPAQGLLVDPEDVRQRQRLKS